jgi:hypothetical protein
VAGCCERGYEPSGSFATELVSWYIRIMLGFERLLMTMFMSVG